MSFFDDASLVFLPRGAAGKDGKAYSIKPTDGTGDFTFSRGSNLTATRVGADGLIEKGRENLLLQSNQFDTTWTLTSTSVTSGQAGYDGSNDAWLLEATGTSSTRVQQTISTDSVQTISVYAKKGTSDYCRISLTGASTAFAFFDLANGSLGTLSNQVDASITSVGSGWYRCSLTRIGAATSARIYVTGNNTLSVSVGANIYIQDAQLEIGLAATDYIESGATTGKAGLLEDEPRFDYSGGATCPSLLLEPSRTNLVTQSEYWGVGAVNNSITFEYNTSETLSPEGLYNAVKLTATGSWQTRELISSTIGTISTISVYVKAVDPNANNDFKLSLGSGQNSGRLIATSEWQRFSYTASEPIVGGVCGLQAGLGDAELYVYGFQVEQGSYSTSYIPNHSGGSVTRGRDNIDSTLDTTNIFNTNEGTLYVETKEALFIDEPENQNFIGLTETSTGNYFRFRGSSNVLLAQTVGWASMLSVSNNSAYRKYLFKWNASETKFYVNGTLLKTSTTTATFNPDEFRIGSFITTISNIKQLLTFPEAIPDADCIALTTL